MLALFLLAVHVERACVFHELRRDDVEVVLDHRAVRVVLRGLVDEVDLLVDLCPACARGAAIFSSDLRLMLSGSESQQLDTLSNFDLVMLSFILMFALMAGKSTFTFNFCMPVVDATKVESASVLGIWAYQSPLMSWTPGVASNAALILSLGVAAKILSKSIVTSSCAGVQGP